MEHPPKAGRDWDERTAVAKAESELVQDQLPGMRTQDVYGEDDSGVDPVYQAKARILNDALQDIGMGRYQVRSELRSSESLRNEHAGRHCRLETC